MERTGCHAVLSWSISMTDINVGGWLLGRVGRRVKYVDKRTAASPQSSHIGIRGRYIVLGMLVITSIPLAAFQRKRSTGSALTLLGDDDMDTWRHKGAGQPQGHFVFFILLKFPSLSSSGWPRDDCVHCGTRSSRCCQCAPADCIQGSWSPAACDRFAPTSWPCNPPLQSQYHAVFVILLRSLMREAPDMFLCPRVFATQVLL